MHNILSKIDQFVIGLSEGNVETGKGLLSFQRSFSKKNGNNFFQKDKLLRSYKSLVASGKIKKSLTLEKVLRLKQTRSLSGIVVVSVLTKPYDCPGKCLYCPSEKNVPKSYLSEEPAVMRAIACNYDPYLQTKLRIQALENIGHKTDKINIRIIGGTWSYYPKQYQTWFIKECFRACNEFHTEPHQKQTLEARTVANACGYESAYEQSKAERRSKQTLEARSYTARTVANACGYESAYEQSKAERQTLSELQTRNELSKNRVVEISIETRQDYIDKNEILRLRKLGVTKVELGIQSIYDDVLKFNKRGHDLETTIGAITLLKNAGFKISYQIMLNLPGSNYSKDLSMAKELFSNPDFRPDYLKLYPLALVKYAPIYKLYKSGKYKPYGYDELKSLLKEIKQVIPYYCRIERVIRDIPSQYIVEGGTKVSNLRQIVTKELDEEGTPCKCIRCREVRDSKSDKELKLFIEDYESSNGKEYFLSIETEDRKYLHSILRLRINKQNVFPFLNDSAIIREIHTYGDQMQISEISSSASQHKGWGKKLIERAEEISRNEGMLKTAVIAGVGVRDYFKKLGYELENTYMVKTLNSKRK